MTIRGAVAARGRRLIILTAIAVAPVTTQGQTTPSWTQWGGAGRNFMSDSKGLASSWPASGPRQLWSRILGEGHSAVLVENGRLYTMYRQITRQPSVSHEEVVAALDAASGKTIWEFKYPAPPNGIQFDQGFGPHSTPLIVGNRLFAASSRSELFALDKTTGKRIWSHDFVKEFNAPLTGRGYSGSPLLYNNTIIMTMGGPNQAVAAFDPASGKLLWKNGYFVWAPASPILIDVDKQPQLVVFGGDVVTGMDPANGRELWRHPHKTDWGLNISTPVWVADQHLLLVSSAYGVGTRALEMRQSGGKTTVTEKWHSQRMRIHIGTIIRLGEHAYASSGDFGPAFISAIDLKNGNVTWQDRSFARAQLLYADGKVIVLDEDGALGLATLSPQGLKVLAKATVLKHLAWTPPTLVGTTLYVRDRQTIAAFDLS
jgi:outer membrane protein assembly factor BamB